VLAPIPGLLLVGGIGVMNIMLVSVTGPRQENPALDPPNRNKLFFFLLRIRRKNPKQYCLGIRAARETRRARARGLLLVVPVFFGLFLNRKGFLLATLDGIAALASIPSPSSDGVM